jgi:hypothetical protein
MLCLVLECSGTYYYSFYFCCKLYHAVINVNLLGDSVNTIKGNLETLLEASRDIGLEINAEKTKYVIMSLYPNSGQN